MSERATESLEIERKYEVSATAELPDHAALAAAGFIADAPVNFQLEAVYFDTAAGDLAKHRLAARLRRGGPDAGWHLKVKQPGGTREFHWPVSEQMPNALREEITRRTGTDAELTPLAELRTERSLVLLRDTARTAAIELVDDRVNAHDARTGSPRAWREWEAELVPGASANLLDALEAVLLRSGASPSLSPAKIARATGAYTPSGDKVGE